MLVARARKNDSGHGSHVSEFEIDSNINSLLKAYSYNLYHLLLTVITSSLLLKVLLFFFFLQSVFFKMPRKKSMLLPVKVYLKTVTKF